MEKYKKILLLLQVSAGENINSLKNDKTEQKNDGYI